MGFTVSNPENNRRRIFWYLRVLVSLATGASIYAFLSHGFLMFPGLNWYAALAIAVWVSLTVYSPRAMALVLLTPLLIYRVVKALRKMEGSMETWTGEMTSVMDDLVLMEEELDEKSFVVAQAVRTVVKNATGKEPKVVAIVTVSKDVPPSVYISSPDDALIGEDIEDILEEAVETFIEQEKKLFLKLYELESNDTLAVLVVPHENYDELARRVLEADYEGRIEVQGDSRILELLYNLVREAVVQSSPEEVGRNKPLIAYLTVKQLDKLERKGVIKLSSKAKSMLPLEDGKTRSIVRQQLKEEASERRRKR